MSHMRTPRPAPGQGLKNISAYIADTRSLRGSRVFQRISDLSYDGRRIHHHSLILMLLAAIGSQQKHLRDVIGRAVRQPLIVYAERLHHTIDIFRSSSHEQPSLHIGLATACEIE